MITIVRRQFCENKQGVREVLITLFSCNGADDDKLNVKTLQIQYRCWENNDIFAFANSSHHLLQQIEFGRSPLEVELI